jgi:5'-nucleotidase
MNILLSNDDGYRAPGLSAMVEAVSDFGEVTVIAPDQDRSGASNSLTLKVPVRVEQIENGYFVCSGTPTDCVHLGITGLMSQGPDMIISGINNARNLGDDVLYSGTVGAAMEGRFLGLPAIAVSLAGEDPSHFDTAANVVRQLLERMLQTPLSPSTILNINVPDLPRDQISGWQATRLGGRDRAFPTIRATDPVGKDIYWIGAAGLEKDAGPGTDFFAIANGYVSITPLTADMTDRTRLAEVDEWLGDAPS